MAIKKYVIDIDIDTEIQSFGEIEDFLDDNGFDWDLREEYTMNFGEEKEGE